ncbi:MAG: MetQ/NlpA family ABC transporter substrate-binding protein [Agathobacter sp.]|uniref:MetQ/NlpA family ABC transporter substrate-binding protein n=1 Tax=Agathobacter sp. TaxID=2021311 RepID=UPI00259112A7|nr:MetQ/NlpA family ABC transporter substrate-binding protein [Agathobacter sp.]MCR5677226.1 MetQ/NlpA family ABC transporter substrate-binding protein [Agathobacter sp.]
MKKKHLLAALLTLVTVVTAACGSTSAKEQKTAEPTKIKVGASVTPHSEILNEAKKILAEEGIELEVVEIEDVVTPNTGVAEGSLDANFFQHQPYLDDFNSENKTNLVSIGAIHYEPFGVYSSKLKSLDELEDGAKVAVPNNVTNEARALLLLEQEGVIKLKSDAGITATPADIVENPKNITFVEIDPSQLVNALPDVAVAVINGNYAIEGGLHVKEALAVEANDGLAAKTYANIVVTDEKNKDNAALKKLVEVLQSEKIQKFIEEKYDGAVVPLS